MAHRDRAARDVDLFMRDVERLHVAQHHRGKSFVELEQIDRKSTRLNSSHRCISYAVFCLIPRPLESTLFPYTTLFRSAVLRLRRSSSSRTVPKIIAPVAPSGWPIAIAPPATLIFSCGMLSACM